MYPEDVLPQSCLAAEPAVEEMNKRVQELLGSRRNEFSKTDGEDGKEIRRNRYHNKEQQSNTGELTLNPNDLPTSNANAIRLQAGLPEDETPPRRWCFRFGDKVGSKRWVWRHVMCLGCSFMMVYVAMKGVINLQSSIHEEYGTIGLSSYYGGFLMSTLLLPTITIRYLGCRTTCIVTILCYAPYILAQLHPRKETLLLGGLIAGLAAAPMWVAANSYLSYISRESEKLNPLSNILVTTLFGFFYTFYQMSQVWGNLASSLVLSSSNQTTNATNDICGIEFCPGNVARKGGKPSIDLIQIVSSFYFFCVIGGAVIVWIGVDSIPGEKRVKKKNGSHGTANGISQGRELQQAPTNLCIDNKPQSNGSEKGGIRTYGGCDEMEHPLSGENNAPTAIENVASNGMSAESNGNLSRVSESCSANNFFSVGSGARDPESPITQHIVTDSDKDGPEEQTTWQALCATLRISVQPDLLLLMPITCFLGVEDAFVSAEYTAAFVACAWGIQNIGYTMICYGACNSIAAAFGGLVVRMTGRLFLVMFAVAVQVTVLAGLWYWTPDTDYLYVFFVIAGLWGIVDGVLQAQINAMYGILYPKDDKASYSCFRMWEGVGYVVAYTASNYICTSTKVLVVLGFVVVGAIGYCSTELRLRISKKRKDIIESPTPRHLRIQESPPVAWLFENVTNYVISYPQSIK